MLAYSYMYPYYPYTPVLWPMAAVQPVQKRMLAMLPSDTLQNTLPLCLPYLKLVDIVRLTACSKIIAQICREQLTAGNTHLAHQLLQTAVTEAAAVDLAPTGCGSRQRKKDAQQQLEQFKRAVPWLLDCLGTKPLFTGQIQDSMIEFQTTDLLVMQGSPIMELATAVRLVQSGLRVKYSQLVRGARAGVSNIEVWARAMKQCEVSTDVPEFAREAALCTWEWCRVKVSNTESVACAS